VTFRNASDETALPIRRWESFLPGTGLGGAFVHWNGQSFRFQVADFIYKTHIEQRYGKKILDPDLTIQDWGVTYDELESHYDRFEYLCGVSGKAGNIKGAIQPGGNPFEAPRTREYPTPPMKEPYFGALFRKGAENLGYHPYPHPSANLSQPLHQSRRSLASAMRLLWILRALRLRALRQSQPANRHSSHAPEESEFRAQDQLPSPAHQSG
jgi:gluconate 2-dehydrogenase alpha chain